MSFKTGRHYPKVWLLKCGPINLIFDLKTQFSLRSYRYILTHTLWKSSMAVELISRHGHCHFQEVRSTVTWRDWSLLTCEESTSFCLFADSGMDGPFCLGFYYHCHLSTLTEKEMRLVLVAWGDENLSCKSRTPLSEGNKKQDNFKQNCLLNAYWCLPKSRVTIHELAH